MSRNINILLVDDKRDYLADAEKGLRLYRFKYGNKREHNVSLDYSESPEKGIEALSQKEYSLVILDINFDPRDFTNMDGLSKFLIQVI